MSFMRWTVWLGLVLLVTAIWWANPSTALAGQLTNLTLTRSSNVAGQPTNLVVEYDLATALLSNSFVFRMHITDAFSAPTSSTANNIYLSGMNVEINGTPYTGDAYVSAVRRSDNLFLIEVRLTTTIPAGSHVKLTVDDSILSNSTSAGTYTFSRFETADNQGNAIDTYAQQVQLVTVNSTPSPVPTLSEWGLILMGIGLVGAAGMTLAKRRHKLAA